MSEKITVKYKTRKGHCSCCGQDIKDVKTSDYKEFYFSKRELINFTSWKEYEWDKEDVQEMMEEHAYDAISFFAEDSGNKIMIEQSEIDKLVDYVWDEVIKREETKR